MGYAIHQLPSVFTLPASKAGAALDAIKQLRGLETCGRIGDLHFMWINDSSEFTSASSLEEALNVWRWQAELDDDGGVTELNHIRENLGDEDLLFACLAPFVDDESAIAVVGEDGAVWRWYFSHGAVYKQPGQISFGDQAGSRLELPPKASGTWPDPIS